MLSQPKHVVGVDFSGASDARENVWVAEATVVDGLRVTECAPAVDRFADRLDGDDPEATMAALREFVGGRPAGTALGFDFPFGLPRRIARRLGARTWRASLDVVADLDGPAALETACRDVAGDDGPYVRRRTDEAVGGLCPYHRFVRHQTYHGMVDLLRPLVETGTARVVPMELDEATGDRPLVLEVYPAATLDRLALPAEGYKGRGNEERALREAALDGLRGAGVEMDESLADRVVSNLGGDALDAVTAAVAARQAFDWGLEPTGEGRDWRVEGHSYP